MHTWVYVNHEQERFVEITWFEYEVSVGEGEFGSEVHKEDRHRFGSPEEIREFIEDWFEQLKLDGYAALPDGESVPAKNASRGLPAAFEEALGFVASTAGADELDDDEFDEDEFDGDDDYDGDALDGLDAGYDPYALEEPLGADEPDYERRPIPTLSVDEAFQEKIKEHPYDLSIDPRHEDSDDDDLRVFEGDPSY